MEQHLAFPLGFSEPWEPSSLLIPLQPQPTPVPAPPLALKGIITSNTF